MLKNFIAFPLKEWQGPKGEKILTETIPKMVKLALDLPNKIRCPIPILKRSKNNVCA